MANSDNCVIEGMEYFGGDHGNYYDFLRIEGYEFQNVLAEAVGPSDEIY